MEINKHTMSGSNPFNYNGAGLVAMIGDGCVAIGTDTRLGVSLQTINTNFQKVFIMQDNIIMGLAGLASDIQTFHKKMQYKLNMYRLRENRDMLPKTFASLVGTTLYEHRFGPFFVSPIVIGLQDGRPIIYNYDSIGTQTDTEQFATIGTAADSFTALCESFYRPRLSAEELEDVIANTLVSGLDRDILAGWGGKVYVMTTDKITEKCLKTKLV